MTEWRPPENTYVKVDGDICPVPEIDEFIIGHVLGCNNEENSDRIEDMVESLRWLMSLSDAEVEGGTVYFLDRWTWDTGHPMDGLFGRILEKERERRRSLTAIPNPIAATHAEVMKILDELAKEEDDGFLG